MTGQQRVGTNLVQMVRTRRARANRGLQLGEGIDLDDGLLSVSASSLADCLVEGLCFQPDGKRMHLNQ